MQILLYMLAKHPEKQHLLRKELLEKMPNKDSVMTAEEMKNLPYLRACIKESQRLEPVIVGTLRRVANNLVLNGYQVPKGTMVVINNHTMCRDEKNFKRCNEFIPERFLKSDTETDLRSKQPFAFLPFGFGPRVCIGKRMAELEMELLAAK